MKEVLLNYDNLTKESIDETVIRIKALIINDNDEITLGYSYKTYQFPGGHLEVGETLEEGLIREVKEETGIELENVVAKPFQKTTRYSKNYRNTGLNRENQIYYYAIKTNAKVDMSKASLDDSEKEGDYRAITIPLNDVEKTLINSIKDNPINTIIVDEMLDALREYKKNYRRK